jgi:hypothetical protein
MSKCWNRTESRPTFRYCLEVLQQISEQQNIYAQTEAQFPHDVPYKCVSSDDSMSLINEKLLTETSVDEVPQTSIPRYLELTYDENDSQTNESCCAAPQTITTCEPQPQQQSLQQQQPKVDEQDQFFHPAFGYETPLSIENMNFDIYKALEYDPSTAKSRTLSNSSTVSNRSEHFQIVPENFPPIPETCKRSSLILDREHHHKIYPATKVITRQSGWV